MDEGNEGSSTHCFDQLLEMWNLDDLKLPLYLKKLLIYTGYDNVYSISHITDDDIKAITNYARDELPVLLDEKEKTIFMGYMPQILLYLR